MCNLAKILSIIVMWQVAGSAVGNTPPPPPPVIPAPPFVKVTLPKESLRLGDIWSSGAFQANGKLDVHLVANCPYQVDASFRDLKRGGGDEPLPTKRVMVAINGKQTSLGGRVQVARSGQPTPVSGVDIPVQLQVGLDNFMSFRAGRYNGTLVITVMAVP